MCSIMRSLLFHSTLALLFLVSAKKVNICKQEQKVNFCHNGEWEYVPDCMRALIPAAIHYKHVYSDVGVEEFLDNITRDQETHLADLVMRYDRICTDGSATKMQVNQYFSNQDARGTSGYVMLSTLVDLIHAFYLRRHGNGPEKGSG
jgi:hypothetical protein